jgi:hypothetical protein
VTGGGTIGAGAARPQLLEPGGEDRVEDATGQCCEMESCIEQLWPLGAVDAVATAFAEPTLTLLGFSWGRVNLWLVL